MKTRDDILNALADYVATSEKSKRMAMTMMDIFRDGLYIGTDNEANNLLKKASKGLEEYSKLEMIGVGACLMIDEINEYLERVDKTSLK